MHDRSMTPTEAGVYVSCPPCAWAHVCADTDEAAAAFRHHVADAYTDSTPGLVTMEGSWPRPGVTIPLYTLVVSCLLGAALWLAAIHGVVGLVL